MTKTLEEINAEKAKKPRIDLLPYSAVPLILGDSELLRAAWRCHPRALLRDCEVQRLILDLLAIGDDAGEPISLMDLGAVQAYGFAKHGYCTWRVYGTEQADPETHYASMLRHITEYELNPESVEEGSGIYVLFHAIVQALILYDLLVDPPMPPTETKP